MKNYQVGRSAADIASDGIKCIRAGVVRNHKLGNTSQIHSGEIEERERAVFRDFLISRNGCFVYGLTGLLKSI